MLSIEEARAAVLAEVRPLGAEEVPLGGCLDRVLAEDVTAAFDLPPFANSAMDGFAVRSGPSGRRLTVTAESRAGAPADRTVGEGEAIRISTGAMLPDGADAVLQLELVDDEGDAIVLNDDVEPGRNVRSAGDDVRAGATVLKAGTVICPAACGMAVSVGRGALRCGRRPQVVVIGTGDELVGPGEPLGPGQIHDSNGPMLAALTRRAGAEVRCERVPDERGATEAAIARALGEADLLILSGGVSVGPHDHVKPALHENGVEEVFWRVALRPGKPTWFGVRRSDDTLVLGLPGNPVSAYVTFTLFAAPALARLQGAAEMAQTRRARLGTAVERHPDRDECMRVHIDADGLATPTGPQGSHMLSSLVEAHGLALIPRGDGALPAGSVVAVYG
jgi:molybdopterin molybdotransferase